MKISKTAIGLGLAAVLVSAVAFAGYKSSFEVSIDTVNRTASGSLGQARNSADALQYIGCLVATYDSGASNVFCSARTASGTTGSCSSTLPNVVTQAQNVKGDSHIAFSWDISGYCTYLNVLNNSKYAPKNP